MSQLNLKNQYQYTYALNRDQWAWEFLRRNSDYQNDYQWFISQWRALEKDYGVAPDNDFQAWKQDPRSYKIIDLASEQDGNCAISEDKLLIECWMGYKWGFFQFPLAPGLPATDITTNWRPLIPLPNEEIQEQMHAQPMLLSEQDKTDLYKTIVFDLSKSLKEQLETIKKQVIIAQRRLKKEGRLIPYTIAGKQSLWRCCLRLLDAQKEHISETEIQFYFNKDDQPYDLDLIQNEAHHYVNNYLDILTFMEK